MNEDPLDDPDFDGDPDTSSENSPRKRSRGRIGSRGNWIFVFAIFIAKHNMVVDLQTR